MMFHVLRTPRSRSTWTVRTNGVPDVILKNEGRAKVYARTVCQRLADRLGHAITLRCWNVFERFVDEIFEPAHDPRREPASRRKDAA